MSGKIFLVGFGPGAEEHMSFRAKSAIAESDVVIGYTTYIKLVKDLLDGKEVIEQEKHRLNLKKIDLKPLIERFHQQSEKEFLIALGRGDISVAQLTDALEVPRKEEVKFRKISVKDEHNDRGIQIQGVSNLLVEIANCCKPVPGDEIIGYITVGRGITIHRSDCPNIDEKNLGPEKSLRLAEATWGTETTL